MLQKLTPEHSAFFLGAAPGVAEAAAQTWRSRKPDLNIVGVQDGYFQPDDLPALEAQLKALQPTVILVALGVAQVWQKEELSGLSHLSLKLASNE